MYRVIKTNEKSKLDLGYKLHARRLSYTGKEATRTIKYPLDGNINLLDFIADSIEQDTVNLLGTLNIDEYFNPKFQNGYSVLNFLIDTIKLGFVFQPSTSELASLIENYEYGECNIMKIIKSIQDKKLLRKIETSKLRSLFLQNEFRSTSTENSLYKKFVNVFKKEYQNDQEIINKCIFISKELLKFNGEEQKKFLEKEFSLSLPLNIDENKILYTVYPLKGITPDMSLHPFDAIKRNFDYIHKTDQSLNIEDICGIGSNGNALSNFLNIFINELKNNQEEKYIQSLSKVSNLFQNRDSEILRKISLLKEKAKLVKNPVLADNWSEYRSFLSGKLQSSLTTYNKRLPEIIEQIKSQETEIQKYLEITINPDIKSQLTELFSVSKNILHLYEHDKKILNSDYNLYLILISDTKISLNKEFQNLKSTQSYINILYEKFINVKPSKNKKTISDSEIKINFFLKNIHKTQKRIPAFFGDRKSEMFEKYLKSMDSFQEGVTAINKIENSIFKNSLKEIDKDYFLEQMNKLIKLYPRIHGKEIKTNIERVFTLIFGKNPTNNEVAKINSFSRNKRFKIIPLRENIEINNKLFLQVIHILNPELSWKNQTPSTLIEKLELKKILTSWYLKLYLSFEIVHIDQNFEFLEGANTFIKFFGKELNKIQLEKLINSFIFSEMRGCLNKISMNKFVSRNFLQVIGSEKKFILTSKNEKNYSTSYVQFKKLKPIYEMPLTGKFLEHLEKENKKAKEVKQLLINPLKVTTSKYQIQFLEWFYNGNQKNKKNVEISRSEPALSLEKTISVKWNQNNNQPFFEKIYQKIFYNQPFTLSSEDPGGNKKKNITSREVYIGIDVGEYGLAYSVVLPMKFKILESGFLYDNSYRKLREEVDLLVRRQQLGTFSVSESKIGSMREHIVKTLRNRIHSIALKYNAKIVFELNISAFEEGSNKIRKIYDTIKQSDTYAENGADKSAITNTWGKNSQLIGSQVGAYGTSQFCTKCRKSVLEFRNTENLKFLKAERVSEKSSIFKIETNQDKDFNVFNVYLESEGSIDLENISSILNLSYKFMRPPSEGEVSKMFLHKEFDIVNFSKLRGNSAIFICPFCNHISDADIQAAFNIAIKGYLNDIKKNKNDKVQLSDIRDFMQNKFLPIELN